MDKGLLKNILIVILVIITTFSVFKYSSSLREKYDLLNTLNQIKEQLATLEKQRQNLLQDLEKEKQGREELLSRNAELKDYLRASERKIAKLSADYSNAQKALEEINSKFALLRTENTILLDEKAQISLENENLKAKLNSITELKKAIKELKRQAKQVRRQIKEKTREKITAFVDGNRGFLLKDGIPTYQGRVRIEVIPASPAGGPASKE